MDLRILIASDGPNMDTGYGKLTRTLGEEMSKNFEVGFISFQHHGKPLYYKGPVYSGLSQAYIDYAVEDFKPDIIIHIRDPVVHTKYFQYPYQFSKYRDKVKVIGYIMAMYDYYDSEIIKSMSKNYDYVTVPTKWGFNVYRISGFPVNMMSVVKPWIPKPVKPKEVEIPDNYLLFVGVADDRRKNHVILIDALRKLDEYNLVLVSSSGAYNIEGIVEKYGLQGRVYIPKVYIKGFGIDEQILAYLYKNAKVYVSASSLEGIDLPVAEALSYGTKAVISDIPVHRELYGKYAKLVKTYRGYSDITGLYWIVDVNDLVNKVREVENEKPPNFDLNEFSVENAVRQFYNIFKKVLD